MTEEQVVNAGGEEVSENGEDHRKIKANGVARENGDVGGKAVCDSVATDLVARDGEASEEEHKVNGESQVMISEGECVRKDAVTNGSAEKAPETATVDVVLREGESEHADGQNGSGSVAVSEVVTDTVAVDVQNGVVENEIRESGDSDDTVAEEVLTDHDEFVVVGASDVENGVAADDEIGGDANVNGVEECEIPAGAEVSGDENGVALTVTVAADVSNSDREFEAVDVHIGEVTTTTYENGANDVQGRSESISDKGVDKILESENIASPDVPDEDIVNSERNYVEEGIEKNEVPVDVDAVSAATDVIECASEDAQNSLEKAQVEPVSDAGGGVQNGLAEAEPKPSECTEENEIPGEGESGSELVPEGENLSALNSTHTNGDGNVVFEVAVKSKAEPSVDVWETKNNVEECEVDSSSNAVKSDGEPSVDVSEVNTNAVECEVDSSSNAVKSDGEPSVDVSEVNTNAVECEVDSSSYAVKSYDEPSVDVSEANTNAVEVECEVDSSSNAVKSVGEPSVDVSEVNTNAVECEVDSSSNAVKSDDEPSVDVSEANTNAVEVECEVDSSSNAVKSDGEPSADVSEANTNAVEVECEVDSSSNAVKSDGEPPVDVSEPNTNAVECEVDSSSNAVKSDGEPSVDVSEANTNAGESEAQLSNGRVQSESERSLDVSGIKNNNAVESETEPSNGAVQSGSEPVVVSGMKNNAMESEAEPSNRAVQSEGEPSVDVSEMKTNAVESEAEPSNTAVQSECEPAVMSEMKTDAVVSEAEPSNTAVQSESEPSVVAEMKTTAVESESEPLVRCEIKQNTVEFEAELSNGKVKSEGEPSVNMSEIKINAVESEAEPSVEVGVPIDLQGSSHGDKDSRTVTDALDGQNIGAEVVKRPFYYLIRVPRYDDDENIKEQIKSALNQVEQKTKIRDAIRAECQSEKASCRDCSQAVRVAITEERAARDLLRSKRQEMDLVQSTMNRLNNVISVGDIAGKIRNMEHRIQHETLPLNEEKQLIRQIKQLKQNHEELSSNMRKQDQSQQSLDDKDSLEEHSKRLPLLKKEIEVLRNNVLKAEAITKASKKKYDDESNKLNELLAQFTAADDIRQEAYAKSQALKKQLHEKGKYFWEYINAARKGQELAAEGKKEELQCLCVDQVEKIMELWNKNDGFRRDYVRCNTRSTLRRLQTVDGRSLGPDEEPPVIPNAITERASKSNSMISQSTMEQEKKSISTESVNKKDEPISKVVVQRNERNQTTKAKKPAKSAPLEMSVACWGDVSDDDTKEEPVRTKEEEEQILKAEKARKEEEEARLKEKRRLEEIEKAKEALQRKKRNAEKAQQRAALKAQKEAEQKEKAREKRARKKERRKAASADTAEIAEQESASSSETVTRSMEECDQSEKPVEVTKKPQKPTQFTRQTKAKSVPLALRNRGKRRIQPWMWVLFAVLVVVALFYVGNSSALRSSLEALGF
ncbi:titin homolog [Abrus precatorius]|uniref:Titin homolog n=1 Tax=Abrus precatorius TaxID=3816 RepID=A0A8B8LXV5_ABRPR|nr:titin homolog [Abrus precatorius]